MSFVLPESALRALETKYRALADLKEKREAYEAAGIMALQGEEHFMVGHLWSKRLRATTWRSRLQQVAQNASD